MPIGELLALTSGLTFAVTSVGDKVLTPKFKPLTLAVLNGIGGAFLAFLLTVALGKVDDVWHVPPGYLLVGVAGGITNIGIGQPLYLFLLRSMDVSRAQPLVHGFTALWSVLSGILLLGESITALALSGILCILVGTYLLSSVEKTGLVPRQSGQLSLRVVAVLAGISLLWVLGFTLQGLAMRKVDPMVVNMARLIAVSLFLSVLIRLGVNDLLTGVRRDHPLGRPGDQAGASGDGFHGLNTRKRDLSMLTLAVANGAGNLGIGSLLYLMAIKKAGLAISTILGSTQLIWVAIFSALLLRERLRTRTVAGIGLVLIGILLIVL